MKRVRSEKARKYQDRVFPAECVGLSGAESPEDSAKNLCNAQNEKTTAEVCSDEFALQDCERESPLDSKASALLAEHALHDSKAARDLAALYIKAGVPELFDLFGPHFKRFESTLERESAMLESYYSVLQKKIERLLKRKKGATTGQIQRLSIAMSKIIATSRAAFGLPYGSIDPHKVRSTSPGTLSVTLHNHGGSELAPIDITPRKD